MQSVPVKEAVGMTLCHDITEICPGKYKKVAFARGHIVKEEDIEHLLRIGKEHLFIWDDKSGLVHEDDAALRISKVISGSNVEYGQPKEGRVNFLARQQGLLKINIELLNRLNSIPDVVIATAHTLQEVAKGKMLAGTRVIPLAVKESTVRAVEDCCKDTGALLNVLPFKSYKVGIVTTGSEVYTGKIKDAFTPILSKKLNEWGSVVHYATIVPDETTQTVQAINMALNSGADLITVTGGMSVDPDDKTPAAIREIASDVIMYGAPVFPGAMFMLAYKDSIPILGLPGCVMYHRASIFDLVMPRILAGIRITKHDITSFAHGGLCESCPECHYPCCSFGKCG